MSRVTAFSGALMCSLLTFVSVGLGPPAHADPGVRVLLTGDSIVQGFHGDWTWRYRLAKEFSRQATPVDFVGSRRAPYVAPGWRSADYADPSFDSDHFGFGGSTLEQQAQRIGPEVARQRPDLVVVAAGVNDLRNGATPAQVVGHLRAWFAAARSAKSDVRVVVSPVLDAAQAGHPELSAKITAYDALLPSVVASLSTEESSATLADTPRGWRYATHTYDDVHPTPTGETLIAQRIAETLHTLGVLPHGPAIFRQVAWSRTQPVTVAVRRNRARLSWSNQALSGANVLVRRVGARKAARSWHGGGRATVRKLRRGARYEFRIQVVRGRMTGPWGPVTRVRVHRR